MTLDRKGAWKTLAALAMVNLSFLLLLLVPANILIAHTPSVLALSYQAGRAAPVCSFIGLILGVALTWRLRPASLGGKAGAGLLLVPVVAVFVLSHATYLEWYFAPATGVIIAPIDTFRDTEPTDMVIGVEVEGASRAYPVRYLAYHHMVNDQLGTKAILPTY